jgi:hypothetical protein
MPLKSYPHSKDSMTKLAAVLVKQTRSKWVNLIRNSARNKCKIRKSIQDERGKK